MKFKISELVDFNSESIRKNDKLDEIHYLDTANLTEGVFEEIKKYNWKEDKVPSRARRRVKENDILVSTVRPNQKHYGFITAKEQEYIVSTGFAVITPNTDKVDPYYLYQYLTLEKTTNYLQMIAENSTSAYPSIKPKDIGNLEIELPNLNKQKQIGDFLWDINKKIHLNSSIISNLEELAQTLFKRWFVDFEFPNEEGKPYKSSGGKMVESELGMIPKGWEVSTIGEQIYFQNGHTFKSKDLLESPSPESYSVFKMGNIKKGGGINHAGTKSYYPKKTDENLKRFLLKKDDLLMCMTDMKNNVALLGHTALMDVDDVYLQNQRVGLLRPVNTNKIDYPFIYILTNSDSFLEDLRSRANSGVQVNLSTKEIKNSKVIVPNREIHQSFNKKVKSMFEKIFSLTTENIKLNKLRDTLLPKLLSGEIELPDDMEVTDDVPIS